MPKNTATVPATAPTARDVAAVVTAAEEADQVARVAVVEADQAAARVEAILEQARQGADVKAEEIRSAREVAELAALRATASHRAAEKAAAEADRAAQAHAFERAATIVDEQANPAPVIEAVAAARTAILAVVDAVNAHDAAIRQAGRILAEAGASPMTEYRRVEHRADFATQEPFVVDASRTAPTVSEDRHGPRSVSFETGRARTELDAAGVVASLLAEVTHKVSDDFDRKPLAEVARAHGDRLARFVAMHTEAAA